MVIHKPTPIVDTARIKKIEKTERMLQKTREDRDYMDFRSKIVNGDFTDAMTKIAVEKFIADTISEKVTAQKLLGSIGVNPNYYNINY
jgi:hypothetical protein